MYRLKLPFWAFAAISAGAAVLLVFLEGIAADALALLEAERHNIARLAARFAVFLVLLISITALTWRLSRIRDALVRSVYDTFYPGKQGDEGTIYRANCFRLVKRGTLLALWYRFRSWLRWRLERDPDEKAKLKPRIIAGGRTFLVCVARHGHQDGEPVAEPTTLPLYVDQAKAVADCFAGKVLLSNRPFERAIDHDPGLVNGLASRIAERTTDLPPGCLDLTDFTTFVAQAQSTLATPAPGVTHESWDKLRVFMEQTNTNPRQLVSINRCRHCNHFVGFKIYGRKRLWGVITIDALDARAFHEICGISETDGRIDAWLGLTIRALGNGFSALTREL